MIRLGWIFVAFFAGTVRSETVTVDADSVIRYVLSCRKTDGAFGPAGQRYSGLAWTFPAVMTLNILGQDLADPNRCLETTEDHTGTMPYTAMMERALLERLILPRIEHPLDWTAPVMSFMFLPRGSVRDRMGFRNTSTEVSYGDIVTLWQSLTATQARGYRVGNKNELVAYVRSCQNPAGHYYSHILPTAYGVLIHVSLDAEVPQQRSCVQWIRSCQTAEGGFRFSPDDPSTANRANVWYTCEAVAALTALKERVVNLQGCIEWINNLQNSDGGFGDRPGTRSRLASTYLAVYALEMLTGNARRAIRTKTIQTPPNNATLDTMNIFQAYPAMPMIEPQNLDAVSRTKLNLIGIKTRNTRETIGAIRRLNQQVRTRGLPVRFAVRLEMQSRELSLPDSTVSDHPWYCLIEPGAEEPLIHRLIEIEKAATTPIPWNDFRATVLEPLENLGAMTYSDIDFDRSQAYRILDESAGYAGIVGGGAGGSDNLRRYPFLEAWMDTLGILPNNDSHGNWTEWMRDADQSRILFLAKGYDLADFLDAARRGRTVCIIREPGRGNGWMYYGSEEAVETIQRRLGEWKWWK